MRLPWQRDDRDSEADLARTPLTERDDRLSDYLDGFMAAAERRAFESEVERDDDLRTALEGMRSVKASMGMLGLTRAPRSFALSPATAPKPAGVPRIELFARFGAVAAALVLTVSTLLPSGGAIETSLRTASDAVATSQQAADGVEKRANEAPATGRAAAPAQAPEGAPSAGGALVAPASAPAAPQPFGTTANSSSGTSAAPPSAATPTTQPLRPVELSRGGADGVLWYVQIGLAAVTVALALVAAGLFVKRQLHR